VTFSKQDLSNGLGINRPMLVRNKGWVRQILPDITVQNHRRSTNCGGDLYLKLNSAGFNPQSCQNEMSSSLALGILILNLYLHIGYRQVTTPRLDLAALSSLLHFSHRESILQFEVQHHGALVKSL